MIDAWDPAQYGKFQREREQPFFDLLALVRRRPGMRVLDLGCGTGTLTRTLHEHVEACETATSESFVTRRSPPAAWDLIFSNAALHWVEDHEALIPRLAEALAPSG